MFDDQDSLQLIYRVFKRAEQGDKLAKYMSDHVTGQESIKEPDWKVMKQPIGIFAFTSTYFG